VCSSDLVACWLQTPDAVPPDLREPLEREEISVAEEA
jgi:hypothetical protein